MLKFTDLLIFDLTRDCNINCEYCLMRDKHKHKNEVVSFEIFKKVIDKLIKQRLLQGHTKNFFTLVFHGGEPLTVGKKNFYKFSEYAYKKFAENKLNLFLGCQTNLLLLDDEYAKIFKKFDFSIGVSLDGFGPSNDYRLKNSREIYEKKIEILQKNKVPFGIMSVLTDKNAETLNSFRYKIKSIGADVTTLRVENPEKNKNFKADISIIKEVYKGFIEDFVSNKTEDKKFSVNIKMALIDLVSYHKKVYKSGCNGKICGTAIGMISVRPDGWFGYCDRFTHDTAFNNLLHIDTYDFLSIKQLKSAIFMAKEKIKIIKKLGCDSCRADYICNHGCMTFNFPTTGKFGIQDDECELFTYIYDYFKENMVYLINKVIDNKIKIDYSEEIYDFRENILDELKQHNIFVSINREKKEIIFRRK